MSRISVPSSVRKVLLPDEEVLGKTGNSYKDLYATSKRLLCFEKPSWLAVLILVGVLPYFLAILLAGKSYSGSIDYSKISRIILRSNRSRAIAGALFVGLLLIALGLFIVIIALTVPYEESRGAWVIGLFFIVLGILLGAILAAKKAVYWQIELVDKPGRHPGKWRIPKYPRGDKATEVTEFTKMVAERAAVQLS